MVGISKLARVVEIFSKRLQNQEKLTAQICQAIETALKPEGVAVLIDAEHQCMTTRGLRHKHVSTITTQFTGVFKTDRMLQERFLRFSQRGDAGRSSRHMHHAVVLRPIETPVHAGLRSRTCCSASACSLKVNFTSLTSAPRAVSLAADLQRHHRKARRRSAREHRAPPCASPGPVNGDPPANVR